MAACTIPAMGCLRQRIEWRVVVGELRVRAMIRRMGCYSCGAIVVVLRCARVGIYHETHPLAPVEKSARSHVVRKFYGCDVVVHTT